MTNGAQCESHVDNAPETYYRKNMTVILVKAARRLTFIGTMFKNLGFETEKGETEVARSRFLNYFHGYRKCD